MKPPRTSIVVAAITTILTFILVDAALGEITRENWAAIVTAFSTLPVIVVVAHFKSMIRFKGVRLSRP